MPHPTRILCFVLVSLLVLVSAIDAQVCSDPANLTANCGFVTDTTGWTVIFGTNLTWNPVGNQGPGSASVVGESTMGYMVRMDQCVGSVAASTGYGYGAAVQAIPEIIGGCSVYIQEYSDGACSTGISGGFDSTSVSSFSGWTDIAGSFTTTGTTQSVMFTLSCDDMQPFSVIFDDLYFGVGLMLPVELSSFNVE